MDKLIEKVRTFAFLMGAATMIGLSARFLLIESFKAHSNDMAPEIQQNDFFFVWKTAYSIRIPFTSVEIVQWKKPSPGDTVLFTFPERPYNLFLSRVVAIEGQTVEIKDGKLFVKDASNLPTLSSLSKNPTQNAIREKNASSVIPSSKDTNYGPIQLPRGYFFVLNGPQAEGPDSRTYGPIPFSCIRGKVFMVWKNNSRSFKTL